MAPRTLPGWHRPTWYPPGLFNPVLYADGGGDEPAPADGGGDLVVETDDPADDWTPPTREEYEKLLADKSKASAEAANRRKWMRAAGLDPKTGQKLQPDEPTDEPASRPQQDPSGDEPRGLSPAEVKRQVDRATAEAELRGRRQSRALVTGVNTALATAGWNGQRLGSLMKLIDLDDVEIDQDGSITGLDEQIADIKTEWPEFFKRQRTVPSTNGAGSGQNGAPAAKVDTADKPAPPPVPKSWAEHLAQRALRG